MIIICNGIEIDSSYLFKLENIKLKDHSYPEDFLFDPKTGEKLWTTKLVLNKDVSYCDTYVDIDKTLHIDEVFEESYWFGPYIAFKFDNKFYLVEKIFHPNNNNSNNTIQLLDFDTNEFMQFLNEKNIKHDGIVKTMFISIGY